uniref:Multidrug and toxin extrusion protein 1-like n=1 Tax=Sphaeramia orbicularis TaxID=375764 RepID=A0A673AD52_9TELE
CFSISCRCHICRTRCPPSFYIHIYHINKCLSPPAGWSVESLQEWGSYMKLAIPSTLMTCFEWWVYEFGGFFAGMLSEDELAAQHAVIMVAFITYMVLALTSAACARVGNALGAGDTERAILSSKVSLTLAVEGVVLGSCKTVIGYLFTSDENIVDLVSHLMNAYCFLQFFDGLVCVCTGIFLGTGKQKIPAVANLIGYYGIGLSLSVTLTFVAKLRVLGNDHFGLDGYVSVSTAWHDGNMETQGAHVVQQVKAGRLSATQLILRRGLTVLGAVGLLALGVGVHFLVPLPEIPLKANDTLDSIHTTYSPNLTTVPILIQK